MRNEVYALLSSLAEQGSIRQLDYQFARFIGQQAPDSSPLLIILVAALSAEVGRGHICLSLWDEHGQLTDIASKLGVFGEQTQAIQSAWLQGDWSTILADSSLVCDSGQESVPLIFDGQRLYLHRYWFYEVTLSARLHTLATPIAFSNKEQSALSERLNLLFARDYPRLFSALSQVNSQIERQKLVMDYLDVESPDSVEWERVEQCLIMAKQADDLVDLEHWVPQSACLNWQKVAAATALTRSFTVVSGGPGTGKTTTVTKLLAALLGQSVDKALTIKLVAPTGKAAARLTESIAKAVQRLPVEPELKALIPTQASTIHRLLGALPNSAEFRHHKKNPLHLDLLIVDEASMVDLPLMVKLVEALPTHARLVLLGDKDQLASVEGGAVLGDICHFLAQGYSHEQGQRLASLTGFKALASTLPGERSPIADCLCMLQKSYRFNASSGIGQLAKAVNSGQGRHIDEVWRRDFADISHYDLTRESYQQMLKLLVNEYRGYLSLVEQTFYDDTQAIAMSNKARAVLEAFNGVRLLCAVREGDFGVTGLNYRIERALAARQLISVHDEMWYHGRPVMVTSNDHSLGLYNGDIGMCLRDEEDDNHRLKVYFELPDGQVKAVLPSRVPPHETAYAMTIHKSQGSEFAHTLMILPPDYSPILTRELIYTGITRAKSYLTLLCDDAVLKRGIKVRTQRASGLVEKLDSSLSS
ncbi:exodeoxyribonuclease V subunit alpha [Vibrio palustris]|uniref:RecBCD enzyme subunit RecD n=1 Tax=Vibrio palustris TaxID=1918946 RepID=A0A1R4AZU9_9VIBR|nr:exodeoxyribonuclease V subunit alpha [Vibrio palustris]SJL82189.1 RecBCD enzyme subunit RecD [Vibrio palustris]